MASSWKILKILIIGSIGVLTFACAPLRPLAPQPSPHLPPIEDTQASQKPEPKGNIQKITGIAAWDRVLSPWLGTPYLYGGNTKKGTDCSGFVSSVYLEKEGFRLPRTSAEQFKVGSHISKRNLKISDLVFFGERGRVNHVGIYVGKGNFIHSSSSRGVIVTALSDNYWDTRYMGARRYL
ncbi:MAG: C40 family peptidase [Fibromonadaceae bacterium]|jgi:cell wall-associated NlpC family hydrolase|nr:C40 family peptidase [Fibromonadaceae bacterium]